jgi:hypothetical protein
LTVLTIFLLTLGTKDDILCRNKIDKREDYDTGGPT